MFINPKTAVSEGWIKFPTWMTNEQKEKCIQPNALDWTADTLFSINIVNIFSISETEKKMRGYEELPLFKDINEEPYWCLNTGAYDVMSDFTVNVPMGVAVLLYPRSTFVRNGLFIANGIFDQGFTGAVGCTLHNPLGICYLYKGTRIAQIAFIKSEDSGIKYAGQYNTAPGQHWTNVVAPHAAQQPDPNVIFVEVK